MTGAANEFGVFPRSPYFRWSQEKWSAYLKWLGKTGRITSTHSEQQNIKAFELHWTTQRLLGEIK
ncbi:MAG: hypothetical protein JSS14_22120 [Proteobacteria bacterium]|nr:hypothetical protein [Pseudomonadota bacterium]